MGHNQNVSQRHCQQVPEELHRGYNAKPDRKITGCSSAWQADDWVREGCLEHT